MHSRGVVFLLAVAVSAFAGCGGTKTVTTAAPPKAGVNPPAGFSPDIPPPRSVTYNVSLSGAGGVSGTYPAPAGARHGSGLAVISVNAPRRELCWQFSQLKNVTAPTVARIYRLAGPTTWQYGYKLGRPFKSSGCLPENPTFLGFIGAKPQQLWVSIDTAQFRFGAVRGQL
jgi:hypothetical protein